MATLKEIKETINFVQTIENITKTYQEIANLRMRQIRDFVLKNRKMFEEILATYQRIKNAYFTGLKSGILEKIEFPKKSKKLVFVFLSANEFFYGGLINEIWKKVKKEWEKKSNADLLIIGKVGKNLAETEGFEGKFFYFDLDDVRIEKEKLESILNFLKNYERIVVFRGKYKKGFLQEVESEEIAGELKVEKEGVFETYIFEPSPKEVLEFFEKEILGILFHQSILEHQLARYAARVKAMFEASERAKKIKKNLDLIFLKLKRGLENKRQITLFGGQSTWKTLEK